MALSATTTAADDRARSLREAVVAGDYAAAEEAADGYFKALETLWQSLTEAERAVSPIPVKALELLNWAREMTIIQRSFAANQLFALQKASRYETGVIARSSVRVQG